MEEGKWYKCIETGSGVSKGSYYQCVEKNAGHNEDFWSEFTSVYGENESAYNRRFDPTPHTRTTFPNMPNLIERVSKIDPAAAEWLEFGDHSKVDWADDEDCLSGLFVWHDSPQGREYWDRIDDILTRQTVGQRSAPMERTHDRLRHAQPTEKEYEYKATGTVNIMPENILKYNPCDTEFGKFVKFYYGHGLHAITDVGVVDKLVKDQRFSWLNWISENTPFVKRTEKKDYVFSPDNLRITYGTHFGTLLEMKNKNGEWLSVFSLIPGNEAIRCHSCTDLPVQMDGDKIAIK